MLSFHRIRTIVDPYFLPFFNLYTHAFPPYECRSWAGIELELNNATQFCANALLKDNEFVGLLDYWIFEHFLYIEHFAIIANLRGQHIGRYAINMLTEETNLPIVLEVEMPVNSMAIRRIRFYEKLKFSVISQYYAQPTYGGDGFMMPMLIMSDDAHYANTHFELIKNTLFEKVYEYSPIKNS